MEWKPGREKKLLVTHANTERIKMSAIRLLTTEYRKQENTGGGSD